jgi:hypothetical protein
MLQRVAKQASTHQSWQKDSVRAAVAELKNSHPSLDEAGLIQLFAERMKADDTLLSAAAEYVVILAVNSLQRAASVRSDGTADVQATRAVEREVVVANIKEQIMLLNLEMPNGKRMRWCTGAEMEKFGGAYVRIGKKVGKTKMVGSELSEQQVREIVS